MKELNKKKSYDLSELTKEQIKQVAEFVFENKHENQVAWGSIEKIIDSLNKWKSEEYLCFHKDDDGDNLWGFTKKSNKEVINAKTLFGLKIGDTFEYNGFVCEVKEKIKKWYYLDGKYQKLDKYVFGATEITNKEFIKQLEENAR